MKLKLSGKVLYANGEPIANVSVHIFDQDVSGRQDDDLTIIPGLSDEHGRFKLTYEPLRYLDYHTIRLPNTPEAPFNTSAPGMRAPDLGDIYLPYLQFNYTFNGQARQHREPLSLFQKTFHLPEFPPVEFLPSMHGFKFTNSFSGYFLPISPPAFLRSRKVSSRYGLCGGMCAAAIDYALAGKSLPQQEKVPRQGTRLHRYLFQRQMDSLGGMCQQVVKVAQWTCLPDNTLVGTERRSASEFEQIRRRLEDRNLLVLALIYDHATSMRELGRVIFNNHQVLAYACQMNSPGGYTINIYDPNLPGRDDVVIQCQSVLVDEVSSPAGLQPVFGLKSMQWVGSEFYRKVRGFFTMPYTPVKPLRGL